MVKRTVESVTATAAAAKPRQRRGFNAEKIGGRGGGRRAGTCLERLSEKGRFSVVYMWGLMPGILFFFPFFFTQPLVK